MKCRQDEKRVSGNHASVQEFSAPTHHHICQDDHTTVVMIVTMVMVVLHCYAFCDCGITMNFDLPPAGFGKVVRISEFRVTLTCCQLGLGRQRQQCGLAAANRAAASWRANRLNERRSTNVEWNVQCRLTGEHFEKIIVGNGHKNAR